VGCGCGCDGLKGLKGGCAGGVIGSALNDPRNRAQRHLGTVPIPVPTSGAHPPGPLGSALNPLPFGAIWSGSGVTPRPSSSATTDSRPKLHARPAPRLRRDRATIGPHRPSLPLKSFVTPPLSWGAELYPRGPSGPQVGQPCQRWGFYSKQTLLTLGGVSCLTSAHDFAWRSTWMNHCDPPFGPCDLREFCEWYKTYFVQYFVMDMPQCFADLLRERIGSSRVQISS
jgi:hypothetical protein